MTDIVDLAFRVNSLELAEADRRLNDLDGSSRRATGGVAGFTSAMKLIGGLAAAAGLGVLIKDTVAYGDALAEVSTLVDTATFDIEGLSEAALDMSREFGSMPIDNVNGFYQAISAGADTADKAIAAMNAANILAVAGVTDIGTAVDGLTSIMNAYNGEAGTFAEISDAMFVAVKLGKTTIGELSASIGGLAPIASQAGVSLEEVLAATAALTAGGVTTSIAMTGLKGIISAIIKPSSEAAAAAERMGLDFSSTALETLGLQGFLETLTTATKGSKDEMALLFGGVEALGPVMALTGGAADKFGEALDAMETKAGAARVAFEKMTDTAGFQSDRIFASIAAGFIAIGDSIVNSAVPGLETFADAIPSVFDVLEAAITTVSDVWDYFSQQLILSDAWPYEAINNVADGFGAIGEAIALIGPYMGEIVGGLALVAAAKLGILAIGAAFAVLTSPITATVIALGGIILVLVKIIENWDSFKDYWDRLWADMAFAVEGTFSFIENFSWDKFTTGVKTAFDEAGLAINNLSIQAPETLSRNFETATTSVLAGTKVITTIYAEGLDDIRANATANALEDMRLNKIWEQEKQDELVSSNALIAKINADAAQLSKDALDRAKAEELAIVAAHIDAIAKEMEGVYQASDLMNISVTEGAQAAREAELAYQGWTPEMAKARAEMEAATKAQGELSDALTDSFANADSWKDVFTNFGQWLEDWLRDLIARFAAQKIMLYFGSDINAVMSGIEAVISGNGAGSLTSALSGIGGKIAGVLGGGSAASAGTGSLAAAQASTTAIQGGGAAAAANPLGAMVATIAAVLGATYALGEEFGRLVGAADEAKAGFGALVAGLPGAVVGAAIGGSWEQISTGVRLAFSGGELAADAFDYFEKEKSLFRGTASSIVYSELDEGISEGIYESFENIRANTVATLTAFGVESGDALVTSVFDSMGEVLVRNEQEFGALLLTTTDSIYKDAFEEMNPRVAQYIQDHATILEDGSTSYTEAAINLAASTFTVAGAVDLLNLTFPSTSEYVSLFSQSLIDASGGIEEFTTKVNAYYELFFTEEEKRINVLEIAQGQVGLMNEAVEAAGFGSVTTMEGFRELVESLNLNDVEAAALFNTLMETAPAFALVATEAANADAQWKLLNDTMILLGFTFESGTPKAEAMRLAIEELDGGMDTFSQSIQTYMEVVYSADELSAISAAQAGQNAIDISAAMGLTGDAVIDTKEELKALGDAIAAELTPATVGGINILGELSGSVGVLEGAGVTAEEAIGSLAPSLQGGFELISGSADQTAELMSVAAASMVVAADAMSIATGGAGVDIEILAAALDILAIETLGSLENAVVDATVVTDIFITGTGNATQSVSTLDLAILAADGTMVNFEGAIANADGTVTLLDGKIVALDEKIVSLDGAVINADGSLTALDGTVSNLDGVVVAADGSVTSLDGAIFDLDGTIVSADGSVISLAGAVIDADANIRTLDGTVVDLTGVIGGLDTVAGSADTAVGGLDGSVSGLAGSASTADGNVDGLTGAVGSLGSKASSVVGDLLKEIGSLKSAANSVSKAIGGPNIVDGEFTFDAAGSFATGLDYVPRDGFIAELHRGEMVVPANDAKFLRGTGAGSNGNAAQLDRIAVLLEETRSDNAQLANVNVQIMNDIAVSNRVSADTLKEVKRVNDRILRKTGEAA